MYTEKIFLLNQTKKPRRQEYNSEYKNHYSLKIKI